MQRISEGAMLKRTAHTFFRRFKTKRQYPDEKADSSRMKIQSPRASDGKGKVKEATRAIIDSDGLLRTGDLCYIDEDGYIFVVDRLKELIKYKGYQVPPAELETILLTHPQIEDAAVIPFPAKEVGQFLMAYVVRKLENDLSGNGVMDFVASQVAPYKKIRRVAFVSAIPKNPSGKILRKDHIKLATSSASEVPKYKTKMYVQRDYIFHYVFL
ncbi:hypothetical protein GIB67_006997 [Kingdonia uniflora]|uniref:AMP-binding enzyme C-terminal domain-containing protein n=1 Tax=Kingdonia uniflora TaxID=39325 RepID=A0A7J7NZX5_9MAGN|nr:hypothetical protein GIB67_006997 [Kingdonia uniflora]